jgi:hypothetical protein
VKCRLRFRGHWRDDIVLDQTAHEGIVLVSMTEQGEIVSRFYFRAALVVKSPDGCIEEVVYDEGGS